MKIRPALFKLLLALLLLAGQQMGMMHAISHATTPLSSSSHDQHAPHNPACDQCLAFASIGAALTNPDFAWFADSTRGTPAATVPDKQVLPAAHPPFHSRAPPALV